ncbi:MAG TPA: MarR family transcriptional regulator [Chloroflexia bacterium]|nr:MarR family transcriptional regulator [Chloroflexia bacterium]
MTQTVNRAGSSKIEDVVEEPTVQTPVSVEEAVTQVIATMPRMFRTIKHQIRSAEAGGPSQEVGDTQTWVLHALATGTQLTSELAKRFNVTTPTITRMVDGLVDKGYIKRRPDSEDRRRIYLELTDAGWEATRNINELFRSSVARFLSPLSERQLADIVVACRHLQTLLPNDGYDYSGLCPPRPAGSNIETEQEDTITNTKEN